MRTFRRLVTAYGLHGKHFGSARFVDEDALKATFETELRAHCGDDNPATHTRTRKIPQNHTVTSSLAHYDKNVEWLDDAIADHSIILLGYAHSTVTAHSIEVIQPIAVFGNTVESMQAVLEEIRRVVTITDILYAVDGVNFDDTTGGRLVAKYLIEQFHTYIPFGKRSTAQDQEDVAIMTALADLNASGGNIQPKYHCMVLSDTATIAEFFPGNDALCAFLENLEICNNVNGGRVLSFSSITNSDIEVAVAYNGCTHTNEKGAHVAINEILSYSPEYIIMSIDAALTASNTAEEGMLAPYIDIFDTADQVRAWKEGITDEYTGELERLIWCVWERVSCVDAIQFPEIVIG